MDVIKRKYGFIALAVIGLIVVAILFYQKAEAGPPQPEVRAGDKLIQTTQGSYCWSGLMEAKCVDYVDESPKDVTPVNAGETVVINFKKQPLKGTIHIEEIAQVGENKLVESQGNAFKLPEEKGIRSYLVSAHWEQGSVRYLFSVEVR